MYNGSPVSLKAQKRIIDRDQTSRPPTERQVSVAFLTARLHYAATCGMSQEAREQIRILTNITAKAHEWYMDGLK